MSGVLIRLAGPVHLAAVADSYHEHEQVRAVEGVDDAVAADAQPPNSLPLSGEQLALEWRLAETLDCRDDALLCVPWQRGQSPGLVGSSR